MKSLNFLKPLNELDGNPDAVQDPLPDKQKARELETPPGLLPNQLLATPDIDASQPQCKWVAEALPATVWANDRHLARLTVRAMLDWVGGAR